MTNEKCRVVSHREIGSGYRYIEFEAPAIAADATPGQFVHVRVPSLEKSALRRPFSIFNAEGDRLELLYKTVGRGTAALNEVRDAAPDVILKHVRSAVDDFVKDAEQFDDLTMLCMEYTGPNDHRE